MATKQDDGKPSMASLTSKKKTPAKKTAAKKAATKPAAKKGVDLMVSTATEVENLTKTKALKLAPELINATGMNDFKLGGVMARIQEKGWWESDDHESFKSYVEGVLGIQYRKAIYLINNYDKLVEAEVDWNSVSSIGWTKLRYIINHITADNAEEWADRCAKMNVLEIQDYIKQLESKGSKKGGKGKPTANKIKAMTFKVHADQYETIRTALDKEKEASDTDVDTVALENISLQYLEGTTGKAKGKVTKKQVTDFLKSLGQDKAADLIISIYPDLGVDDEEEEETEAA